MPLAWYSGAEGVEVSEFPLLCVYCLVSLMFFSQASCFGPSLSPWHLDVIQCSLLRSGSLQVVIGG